jgi:hypothetical protein
MSNKLNKNSSNTLPSIPKNSFLPNIKGPQLLTKKQTKLQEKLSSSDSKAK